MTDHIIQISDSFWNIRGSFRIGGRVDIGTHASLVKRPNGKFVLLDSYVPEKSAGEQLLQLTQNGALIEAVINLHPFHTVHCEKIAAMFPDAKQYGTARHHRLFPSINWEPELIETAEAQSLFADSLDFSIPAGVTFIPKNENLHFSSVLAYHRDSKTIHVDDTFMIIDYPGMLQLIGQGYRLEFHPTLAMTLEGRKGAAADFRAWAEMIADNWGDAHNLCAAHSAAKLDFQGHRTGSMIRDALKRVAPILRLHKLRYG